MTSQEHFQELGATASCTVRMGLLHQKAKTSGADEPKVCGMKGDAWFGSVKTCSSLLGYGIESIFQVKTAHKDYPKKFIDEKLKNMPGGVHLVLMGFMRSQKRSSLPLATGTIPKRLCFLSCHQVLDQQGLEHHMR